MLRNFRYKYPIWKILHRKKVGILIFQTWKEFLNSGISMESYAAFCAEYNLDFSPKKRVIFINAGLLLIFLLRIKSQLSEFLMLWTNFKQVELRIIRI